MAIVNNTGVKDIQELSEVMPCGYDCPKQSDINQSELVEG